MNILHLRYFEAVCTYGSISAAAQKLYISQQGLSRAIQRLESELGCELFARRPRGIVLTEDGQFLLDRAKVILPEADLCEEYFSVSKPGRNRISIAGAYGALPELSGGFLQHFAETHPHIQLNFTEYVDKDCDDAVLSGQTELGFAVWPVDEERLEARRIYSRKLCILVHKNHSLAAKTEISTADLDKLPIITVNEKFKAPEVFAQRCRVLGVKPDVQSKVGEIIAVHRMVASNPALAGLTVDSVAEDMPHPNCIAIPIADDGFDWGICLIWKKGTVLSTAAQGFIEELCDGE